MGLEHQKLKNSSGRKISVVYALKFLLLSGRIVVVHRATAPIAIHFSIAWYVVCHIRAPCLNSLMNFDAIRQVHSFEIQLHTVLVGGNFLAPKTICEIKPQSQKLQLLTCDSPANSTDQ